MRRSMIAFSGVRRFLVMLAMLLAMPGLAIAQQPPAGDAKDAKDAKPDPKAAPAQAGPGTAVVKQAYATIQGLLKQKVPPGSNEEKDLAARVTTSVRGFLDIDQLGKRAMTDPVAQPTTATHQCF